MLTTSLLVTAGVNEKTNPSSMNTSNENSLGTLKIRHQPLINKPIRYKGMIINYEPPKNNTTYQYNFLEDEDGYVHMNFTLNVSHLINDALIYFAEYPFPDNYRYTAIETWVNYDKEDYVRDKNIILCNSYLYEDYQIKMSAVKPLYTNGETLACRLWITAYPGITPIPFVQDILGLFLIQEVVVEDIYINPI